MIEIFKVNKRGKGWHNSLGSKPFFFHTKRKKSKSVGSEDLRNSISFTTRHCHIEEFRVKFKEGKEERGQKLSSEKYSLSERHKGRILLNTKRNASRHVNED